MVLKEFLQRKGDLKRLHSHASHPRLNQIDSIFHSLFYTLGFCTKCNRNRREPQANQTNPAAKMRANISKIYSVLCLVAQSCPTLCDPMNHSPLDSSVHGNSPGQNTGVCCHALLQGIFPTQGSNPGLPHCKQILCHLSHREAQEYWNECCCCCCSVSQLCPTLCNPVDCSTPGFPVLHQLLD